MDQRTEIGQLPTFTIWGKFKCMAQAVHLTFVRDPDMFVGSQTASYPGHLFLQTYEFGH